MREIKFRAWDKDTKHMVYSDGRDSKERPMDYDFEVNREGVQCWWSEDYDDKFGYPATNCGYLDNIMQYTGLKDKNGREIYEGDILRGFKYPYLSDENHNYFAEVYWCDNVHAFGIYAIKDPNTKVRGISAGFTELMEDWNRDDWEVIGNIYENPELIGE